MSVLIILWRLDLPLIAIIYKTNSSRICSRKSIFKIEEFKLAIKNSPSARSAAWLARLGRDEEVGGSTPLEPTITFQFHLFSFLKFVESFHFFGR